MDGGWEPMDAPADEALVEIADVDEHGVGVLQGLVEV